MARSVYTWSVFKKVITNGLVKSRNIPGYGQYGER